MFSPAWCSSALGCQVNDMSYLFTIYLKKVTQINALVLNFDVSSMGSALQSSFIKHIKISVCTLNLSISLTKVSTQCQSLQGKPEHPKSKLSMFCAPSQKYCFTKKYDYPEANCLKNSQKYIKILVGPVVLELLIKTCKILFWSITQEWLDQLRFQCYFWVSQTICFRMLPLLSQKVLIILR